MRSIQRSGKLILTLPDKQEQEYVLAKSSVVLGRASTCDVGLHYAKVSRSLTHLEYSDVDCTLIDLVPRTEHTSTVST